MEAATEMIGDILILISSLCKNKAANPSQLEAQNCRVGREFQGSCSLTPTDARNPDLGHPWLVAIPTLFNTHTYIEESEDARCRFNQLLVSGRSS